MPGEPAGDADARAEQSHDERVALPDDFDLATGAESHRHQSVHGGVGAFNVLDDSACARGQLVETIHLVRKVSM